MGPGYGYHDDEYAVGEDAFTKRTRALLKSSSTRRYNEPLIRVLRGKLISQKVELEHSCLGTDIWNGNAVIQIQPICMELEIFFPCFRFHMRLL